MAAALSDTKAGLPVKNGSISTALPPKSSRNAEWPYQVICMMSSCALDLAPSIVAGILRINARARPLRMPVLPLVEIAPLLPARGALIGLDLGTKTIGVAASDPDRRLATGVTTIDAQGLHRRRAGAARARRRAQRRRLRARPADQHGRLEGPRAQSTRAFARNFAKLTALPIGLWDERLSTAAVERDLIAADMSRARRAKVIDQHAAAFILQGALDRLARLAADTT